MKKEYPGWGAPKIREKLIRTYPMIKPPAISTVHAVLDRHGLVQRRRRRHRAEGTALSNTLSVVRPKTGMAFTLPLLPAVAEAMAHYQRGGRPMDTPIRHLFVQIHMPFGLLAASGAIRHIAAKHTRAVGISVPFLGTPPRVVSELRGHRDPESLSAYVWIATEMLREVALPVPM